MNEEEEKLSQVAISFVKQQRQVLIDKFANIQNYQSTENPVSLFMAGSPGAGKTEISKRLIEKFEKYKPVRIDPDEIRILLPGYKGINSYIFQAACSIGVDKLYDHIIDKKLNVIVDGTLASERSAIKNTERSIGHNRKVEIYYIFQEPVLAWKFTQIREEKEGRRISKDVFIDAFIMARENVNKIKKNFGNKIQLNFILKNFDKGIEEVYTNINNVDDYLAEVYTVDKLKDLLGYN